MPIPRIRQPIKTRETDRPVNSLERLNVPSQESSRKRSSNKNPNLAKGNEKGNEKSVKPNTDNLTNPLNKAHPSPSSTFLNHTKTSKHIPARVSLAAASSAPKENLSEGSHLPKVQRPAFSTSQQHYTPRKAPKALTTSFLEAPRQNDGLAFEGKSNDTIQLQQDLTQLHLLHYRSSEIHIQWQRSAEHYLQARFHRLVARNVEVYELSNQFQQTFNHSIFARWCKKCTSTEIIERIRSLSQVLNDLTSMTGDEGKFTLVVSAFRSWISLIVEIQETRGSSTREGDDVYFIEKLNQGWQSEVQALTRKLQSIIRSLDSLGEPGAGSALHQTLNSAKILAANMLEELKKFKAIEQQVLAQEMDWINAATKASDSEDQIDISGSFNLAYQGIWNT
ncbi:MAG: hypothetical protein LQ351_000377 [Letrouitia transgressa]|nr:MAG: hypothetical protein LQ351_000377 [Letrouitia transgressa]